MRIILIVMLALAACGSPQPPGVGVGNTTDTPPDAAPGRAPVSCGQATCGPDEYCEILCTCCGMRPPEAGDAGYTASCLPLPASCHDSEAAECMQRTVQQPCA